MLRWNSRRELRFREIGGRDWRGPNAHSGVSMKSREPVDRQERHSAETSRPMRTLTNADQGPQTALLLVDFINDLDFPEGELLLRQALPAAARAATLKSRARENRVPVIYVNDNFGRWRSDFRAQVQHCQRETCRGREITRSLAPEPDDYFVLKPRHSGFYCTPLELLLHDVGIRRLILAGLATNICVLFTAHDAFMRGFEVIVPPDACAANSIEEHDRALRIMESACKARIVPVAEIGFHDREPHSTPPA